MTLIVQYATAVITAYLKNKPEPPLPRSLKSKKAGCFVSLHLLKDHELRGCIGTILPSRPNLALEVKSNAIAACNDPRFSAVKVDELKKITVSVDVLSEPEPILSEKLLDPKKYGVIVRSEDGRTGVLLPDLEGIDDTHYQLAVAREKAGIESGEKVFLYRFTSTRYE